MKSGVRRLHTGYDYPGPHQGNFCSNGIIFATREESPKLMEVRAAHQFVKFRLLGIDRQNGTAKVRLVNRYAFRSLEGLNLVSTVLIDGKPLTPETQSIGNVAAGDSIEMTVPVKAAFTKQAAGQEAMLNLEVVYASAQSYAPAGHEIAHAQYVINERQPLAAVKAKGKKLTARQEGNDITVGNDKVSAVFNRDNGTMTSLKIDGVDVIADGEGFVYDNHRWIENDRFTDTSNGLDSLASQVTYRKEGKNIEVTTERNGKKCSTKIVYTFYPDGTVDMDVDFTPHSDKLRRAGLVCGINPALSNVNYFAYGPWENYVDRKDGVTVGRYATTVADMVMPYVKPQSTGGREGLRELTLTDASGRGINIETEGNVSFSILPYTDADLMKASHQWEMTARPYSVLHLDAWTRGVGNASCGADVDTLPIYRVPDRPMSYKLRLTPVR